MEWKPAIYEHKAALINKSPAEVASSAELLAEAVLKEYEIYQADNIGAEALGAELTMQGENECPDLAGLRMTLIVCRNNLSCLPPPN